MREKNLSMTRARGWCSKTSARVLNAVHSMWFSLIRLITCSNTSDLRSWRLESRAVDEHPASVSGHLQSNGGKCFKKKPSMFLLCRSCKLTSVLPNSRVQFKILKAESSDMEAAVRDAKIQRNTPVTPGSSLKESISAMEFFRPEIEEKLNVRRLMPVSVVEDACKKFRKCLLEMVVEDKNVRDLMDVEEFLSRYQNLSCPVYKDMLSDFFAEICTDIFGASASSSLDDDEELSGSSLF